MRVGLALGGGAIRGLAHLGVLKVFQEYRIPIDLIVGTSMGGVIGGLVAAGIDIGEIEKFSSTAVPIGSWISGLDNMESWREIKCMPC